MARKPAFVELEKRMFGRSCFPETIEGIRAIMPKVTSDFLEHGQGANDE